MLPELTLSAIKFLSYTLVYYMPVVYEMPYWIFFRLLRKNCMATFVHVPPRPLGGTRKYLFLMLCSHLLSQIHTNGII